MKRHPNSTTDARTRAALVRRVLVDGWSIRHTARHFETSVATVAKWLARYESEGEAGLADRSSRPASSPTRTPARVARQVESLRRKRGLSTHAIAQEVGLSAATVARILRQADAGKR